MLLLNSGQDHFFYLIKLNILFIFCLFILKSSILLAFKVGPILSFQNNKYYVLFIPRVKHISLDLFFEKLYYKIFILFDKKLC